MDDLEMAIEGGESALRGTLRNAQERRAKLTGILQRSGDTMTRQAVAQITENCRTLERLEIYVAHALATLPDSPQERSVAILDHLGAVAAIAAARGAPR